MRTASLALAVWLTASVAWAAGPSYVDDPFGDADFADAPLILDTAYPSRGRFEVSALFASSLIDKYTTHMGALLQIEYNLTDTFGVVVNTGSMFGSLTSIVTDPAGIIGNKVLKCNSDTTTCGRNGDLDITPEVPDYRQVTGVFNASAMWSPLYGKINVVSEIDVNMQAYLLLGAGVNGTRVATATYDGSADEETPGFDLTNNGIGEGGILNDPKVHVTGGVGLQILIMRYFAVRADVRGLFFRDSFNFDQSDTTPDQGYTSQFWFFTAGIGIPIF